MQERLQRAGLVADFFDAIDGRALDTNAFPTMDPSNPLSAGELGCYLSHVGIWKTVATGPDSHALVLEDDVQLRADLRSICEELQKTEIPFDLVRLGSQLPLRGLRVAELAGKWQLFLPTMDPDGSYAYFVSRQGASRLLDTLRHPRHPIDRELNLYWRHQLRILALSPPVVEHDAESVSTIMPSGRATVNTSLHFLARWRRSILKRWSIYQISRSLN
ncbi:glycosyltransferase family 25 protein [Caldimonas brevitalea]|uniref:Glycosyl transferase family 25 domain-containing protein n=1 Tax=Caldimonas brevitalea TaxID=413882 RepID=A0A0G3BMG3_9BURK|nr:hypothetical protein AAW51_3938 [Caldimonas brevitalea]